MRTIIFITFYLIPFLANGQNIVLSGKVSNQNNEVLEYVSIGLIGKSVGTVSDKNGNFALTVSYNSITVKDSLRFSIIGYIPKSISLKQIVGSKFEKIQFSLNLTEKVEQLNEVVVNAIRPKSKVIGSHGKSLLNMYVNLAMSEFPDQNLGSEVGRMFTIRNKNTQLTKFRFYVNQNNFDTVKFRINVYSIKKFKPDTNILKHNIFAEVLNRKSGWIEFDLSQYNIKVAEDVIVAIEWISKSAKGNTLTLPIIMPTTHVHFYKFGSQNKWKRYNSMTTYMELTTKY